MTKQKTIVFGGAFNPPTLAHEAILSTCVNFAKKWSAEIWILPSGNRLDKQIKTDHLMRLAFINAMIEDIEADGIKIDIITNELNRKKVVETIDTVKQLTKTYPDREFVWVFGADSIATMDSWRDGDWMLNNLKMIAIERDGVKCPRMKNILVARTAFPYISSTELRNRLETGEPVEGMVGLRVSELLTK